MSLARKHRPQKFRELVGQDPICQALLHCLKRDDAPQTFLFSGIRGTGKTTLARLYAAAINCKHSGGFEHCGMVGDHDYETNVCPSCRQFHLNRHEDIREIDGASHNSVDHIRELQENLLYGPRLAAKKVYIIDEVHMLSISAFNALLKTLEEPPSYVVFILATTELQKLPATVISRCQTFHLRRIAPEPMLARFESLLKLENITYEPQALHLVIEQAEGSLRDGLTLLEQMIALGGGTVAYDTAVTLMGYAPNSDFFPLWSTILKRDHPTAVTELLTLFQRGFEARMIAEQLTKLAHKTSLILSMSPDQSQLIKLSISDDELAKITTLTTLQPPNDSHSAELNPEAAAIRQFISCLGLLFMQFSGAPVDRYLLSNNIVEWITQHPHPHPNNSTSTSTPPSSPSPASSPPDTSSHLQSPSTPTQNLPPSPPQTQPAQRTHAQPPPNQTAKPAVLPTSWRQLLVELSRTKPIQAQELTYAKVIEYSDKSIALGVDMTNQSSSRLIQAAPALHLIIKNICGFTGSFTIMPLGEQHRHLPISIGESQDLLTQNPQQLYQTVENSTFYHTIKQFFPTAKFSIEHPRAL